jgi:hypothetical protein
MYFLCLMSIVNKHLQSKLLRLRTGVKGAIKQYKGSVDRNIAIKGLKRDILNGIYHVMGQHSSCSEYSCNKKEEDNKIGELSAAFLTKILEIARFLANHARSLLCDVDSNIVEQ